MSVPKINIINYSKQLIDVFSIFANIEVQKRLWFSSDGPEISSFFDDFGDLDFILNAHSEVRRAEYFNNESNELIKMFLDRVHQFREDPQTDFILSDEEELYSDPRWLEIVKTAQEAKAALEAYVHEVENDKK